MPVNFGDYIVYVDESGDHSLTSINSNYPIFVLAFCIFKIDEYTQHIVPALQRVKFRHFGHDMVVLHERDIRKRLHPFEFRAQDVESVLFIDDLTNIISSADFQIVSRVVDKRTFPIEGSSNKNVYQFALQECLEQLNSFLISRNQAGRKTSVVFESRGKIEDSELKMAFQTLVSDSGSLDSFIDLKCLVASKQVNSAGLQLADLVARPIGIKWLNPDQANRAYEVIARKVLRFPDVR